MAWDYSEPESDNFPDGDTNGSRRDVEEAVQHLRDTLTHDMAIKAYRIRYKREPAPDELDASMEELVSEHYNAGLDNWDEQYLYYD